MTEFKIIDNIEMPKKYNRCKALKYPVDVLEIGQGFEVADDLGEYPSGASIRRTTLTVIARRYGLRAGKKFQTAKIGNVIRLKRIA